MLPIGRLRHPTFVARIVGVALVAACADGRGVTPPSPEPRITQARADGNLFNALSAIVTVNVEGADSARVLYDGDDGRTGETPFFRVRAGVGKLTVLGLRASTSYRLAVEALGAGGRALAAPVTATTGALPAPIRTLRLAGAGAPAPGYTLVVPLGVPSDPSTYVIAFDAEGEIAWYRAFTGEGWAVEAKQQPNGNFTVYLGRSYGWQAEQGRFVEITPAGEVVRSFAASAPFFTDPHELLLSFRDSLVSAAHLLAYELRHFDLRGQGGAADTMLAVHAIERQDAAGVTQFRWSAGDVYTTDDWPALNRLTGDLVHPSSLALDAEGNYVLSLQAMDEITKIDGRTGATMWRFGGRHNEFTLLGDPLNGFQGQHSVAELGNGHLLLMDNRLRSQPPRSRAVEYELDRSARVARLVWQYAPEPPVASPIMGSVQRLTNGNTVVGFGAAGRVDEITSSARAVWRATLSLEGGARTTPFYRAIRIASLYGFRAP